MHDTRRSGWRHVIRRLVLQAFVLFADREVKWHFAFERFLGNQIRAAVGFRETPIRLKVKARGEK
jgi:predicted GTPase